MSKPLGGDRDNRGAWSRGLTDALRLLERGRRGRPTEADAPPPSLFPMTPAARQALRMWREKTGTAGKEAMRREAAARERARAQDPPPDNVRPIRKGE